MERLVNWKGMCNGEMLGVSPDYHFAKLSKRCEMISGVKWISKFLAHTVTRNIKY